MRNGISDFKKRVKDKEIENKTLEDEVNVIKKNNDLREEENS